MLVLILFLIAGSALAYLSYDNMIPVSVHLGPYVFYDIPLFYLMIGSLLIGLIFSYLVYMVHAISNSWVLRGKAHQIKKSNDEVLELTTRVHKLEIENEKLKHAPRSEPKDANAL